ncbi:hypothetical protein L1887_56589 [Cichorium endivia]|nr:hypothetical protein L1887_56589 [Cichorium endivia]
MNLLSGSVWKGATLRIGEAKPDFQQRIQQENEMQRLEDQQRTAKKAKAIAARHGIRECQDGAGGRGGRGEWFGVGMEAYASRTSGASIAYASCPSAPASLASFDARTRQRQRQRAARGRPARVESRHARQSTSAHQGASHHHRSDALRRHPPLRSAARVACSRDGRGRGGFRCGIARIGQCEEIDDGAADASHRLVCWRYVAKDGVVLHEEFTKLPVRVVAAATRWQRGGCRGSARL